MGFTFAEKLLSQKTGLKEVVPGQIVTITPDVVLSHDNASVIQSIFKEMGAVKVFNPQAVAIILDHGAPAPTTKHAENHRIIREFVKDQGIQNFFDVGRGICHQVLIEEGLALPGKIILGSDSHTMHAGVIGAFSAGIGRSEMASVWATGCLWLRTPESMKIIVRGKLPQDVTAKDLALKVIGDLGADGGLYMSVEWHGEGVEALDLGQRAVLANMTAEIGAKNSYIPPDQTVVAYLQNRAKFPYEAVFPDPDASYARIIDYNAASIEPQVASPHTVDNIKPLSEVAGTHIDQAFLGTCTNGRLEDLAAAATILKDRHIAPGTRMIVIPASSHIYLKAMNAGYLETFIRAGAVVESPGCGPCAGNHMGVPAIGEVVISSANRNFQGRMGTRDSEIYLASPAVVAASAICGVITHPKEL